MLRDFMLRNDVNRIMHGKDDPDCSYRMAAPPSVVLADSGICGSDRGGGPGEVCLRVDRLQQGGAQHALGHPLHSRTQTWNIPWKAWESEGRDDQPP